MTSIAWAQDDETAARLFDRTAEKIMPTSAPFPGPSLSALGWPDPPLYSQVLRVAPGLSPHRRVRRTASYDGISGQFLYSTVEAAYRVHFLYAGANPEPDDAAIGFEFGLGGRA